MSELDVFLRSGTGRAVLDAVLDSTPSLVFIADSQGRLMRASRVAGDFAGLPPEAFKGRPAADLGIILKTGDRDGRLLSAEELPISRALRGEHVHGAACSIVDHFGERVPVAISAAPFRTPDGEVIGAITSSADLRRFAALERQLRAAVAEKEVLYRELAHRVKNHFQLISGLVALETRDADDDAVELARRMIGRLKSLAAVYNLMGQADIEGRVVARAFLEDVVGPYRTTSVSIGVSAPERLTLAPDQAGPLGMLVNEAVNNSFKHAFPNGAGRIAVVLRPSSAGCLELTIADDGVGYAGPTRPGSQGRQLMRLLAHQLGGEMHVSNRPEGGAEVAVDLPTSLARG